MIPTKQVSHRATVGVFHHRTVLSFSYLILYK
jgi:hypothetical protein